MAASRKILPPEMAMADGGMVPDLGDIPIPGSDFDVSNQSDTLKTRGMIPPPPQAPIAAPQPAAPAPVMAPRAPAPAPMAVPNAPQAPMPSMQDVLGQAQNAAGSIYGQYTPERRNDLYAALLERQNSLPNVAGGALASVGDAIARGYGHSQSDFLDKVQQTERQGRQDALEAFDAAQKGKLSMTQAGMELSKLDPRSAISKLTVASYAPILVNKLGYTPQQVQNMSASQVEAVAKVGADYGGKELENLFHQAQLIVENNYHKQELGVREHEITANALKESANHPVLNMLPAGMQPAPLRAINQQAGIGGAAAPSMAGTSHVFESEADAEKANLPDGTPVIVGGIKGTWRHK